MPSLSASRPRTRECGREIAGDDRRVHIGAEEAAPDADDSATISPMAETSLGTVLVVDDEPTIVEVVGRYLERAGYETLEAADGPEALRVAEQGRPDLIVLDVMLPGFDGIEVMRKLHERPGSPVPVILLTARGEESDRL